MADELVIPPGGSARMVEAARRGRALLVVAGRPDLVDVDHRAIPADAVVLREGDLGHEADLLFGRVVDAWFCPAPGPSPGDLARVTAAGRYEVGGVVTVPSPEEQDEGCAPPSGGVPVLDVRDAVAGHPWAGRRLMEGRPWSTTALMLLAGAVWGFHDIRLVDARRRTSATGRPWVVSSTSAGAAAVEVDREAALMEALPRVFPGLVLADAAPARPHHGLLPAASAVEDPLEPVAADEVSPRLSAVRHLPDGRERRVAYVTVCDSTDYLWGVRALAASLRKTTDVPLLVLAPEGLDVAPAVTTTGVHVLRAPGLTDPAPRAHTSARFARTYSKLVALSLGFLDRAVYLDADTVVLRPVDELFDGEGFAAAPDLGHHLDHETFNSGVLAFTPSADLFQDALRAVPTTPSRDGGDQGFLNAHLRGVARLDRSFNTLRRVATAHPDLFDLSQVKVLHYVGAKPWALPRTEPWTDLDALWFTQLTEQDKVRFIERATAVAPGRRTTSNRAPARPLPASGPRPARDVVAHVVRELAGARTPGEVVDVLAHAAQTSPRAGARLRRVLGAAQERWGQ